MEHVNQRWSAKRVRERETERDRNEKGMPKEVEVRYSDTVFVPSLLVLVFNFFGVLEAFLNLGFFKPHPYLLNNFLFLFGLS